MKGKALKKRRKKGCCFHKKVTGKVVGLALLNSPHNLEKGNKQKLIKAHGESKLLSYNTNPSPANHGGGIYHTLYMAL